MSEFTALNLGNMKAGPYALTTRILTADGKGDMHAVAHILWQVAPPNSAHTEMVSTANTQPMKLTVIGDRAWEMTPDSTAWSSKPADYAASKLLYVRSGGFLLLGEIADLQCTGIKDEDGRSYLTFTYREPKNPRVRQVTAYFDPSTRRPVKSIAEGEVYGKLLQVKTEFRFDPAIAITPPAP